MANLRLKRTILEVVDNQLRENDPPCTKETYENCWMPDIQNRRRRIRSARLC